MTPTPCARAARAFCSALFTLLIVALPLRGATQLSEKTWGSFDSEGTEGTVVADDGSTYVVGNTFSFDPSGDVFILKYDANGSLQWDRVWDGPGQFFADSASDVALAPDGTIWVSGATLGVGGDALLLQFSPDGTLIKQLQWGGRFNDSARSVDVAADGSVYITGPTSSFGDDSDMFVVKFNPDGTVAWQQVWRTGEFLFEAGDGIAVTPDGTIVVSGTATRPNADFMFDAVVLKFDASGTLLWQQAYSTGEIADSRGGVAVGADGSIYVAGAVQEGPRSFDMSALVVKFAADGALVWDKTWGGRSGDSGHDITVAPDGSVFLAGATDSYGAGGGGDAFVLQLNAENGRAIDSFTWGGAGNDHAGGIDISPSGIGSLGATASQPPYVFDRAPSKTSRPRGTVAVAGGASNAVIGSVADAGGTAVDPAASETYAGSTDAALVRFTPN